MEFESQMVLKDTGNHAEAGMEVEFGSSVDKEKYWQQRDEQAVAEELRTDEERTIHCQRKRREKRIYTKEGAYIAGFDDKITEAEIYCEIRNIVDVRKWWFPRLRNGCPKESLNCNSGTRRKVSTL